MQYEVEIGGKLRQVTVARASGSGDGFAVTIDGHTRHVDAARIDAHTLSLLVDSVWPDATVRSYEVTLAGAAAAAAGAMTARVGATPVALTMNGRRRWGRKDGGAAGSGPQRLIAPMPGKVVRVLVKVGDAVTARQPVIVVEAMKMENELRAGREGTVTELHGREGMSVDAGALLLVIQ
jgi:biotin carboxyl carrier protein